MTRAFEGPTRSITLKRYRTRDFSVLNHLTERDSNICLDIYEHRFLTTHQLFQLHFTSYSRARVRSRQLCELGVLSRFRPPQNPGSAPWHYVLDRLGAEIVSGIRNIEADKLYFERNRPAKLRQSPRLDHMRDVNEFFCRLVYAGRQKHHIKLTRWLGENRSIGLCKAVVRPDGIGTLQKGDTTRDFFLEMDRGTEPAQRLREKVVDYEEVVISRHMPRIVLFCFPNERREQFAISALQTGKLTIATCTLDKHLEDPLGPNWLPVRHERRMRLIEIPLPGANDRA